MSDGGIGSEVAMVLTTCKIGKYRPMGEGQLPPVIVGVLREDEKFSALMKPIPMMQWQSGWFRTGYPGTFKCYSKFREARSDAHRIDSTTSGTIMLGTNGKGGGKGELRMLWPTKSLRKSYLARVADWRQEEYLEVSILARDGRGKKVPCLTGLTYLGDGWVLAELLERGLTHQIRLALKEIGHPIRGDVLYGGDNSANRPLLHAWKVWIEGWGEVKAPCPADMGVPPVEVDPFIWSFEVLPLSPEDQAAWYAHSGPGHVEGWDWTPGRIFGPDGEEISEPPPIGSEV